MSRATRAIRDFPLDLQSAPANSAPMEIWGILLAGLGLALGGVLKGAIGVGAPVSALERVSVPLYTWV